MNTQITAFFSNRFCQGTLNAPFPLINSSPYYSLTYSNLFSPFGNRQRNSIKSNKFISSCVPALFCLSSPSYVPRFIISVIIWVSINAMVASRRFTNMFVKSLKIINPFRGNSNPSTLVILKILELGIKTPVFHCHPSPINFGLYEMTIIGSFWRYIFYAPTRCLAALMQPVFSCFNKNSAVAPTKPNCFFMFVIANKSNCHKTAKSLVSNIFKFGSNWVRKKLYLCAIFNNSHDMNSVKVYGLVRGLTGIPLPLSPAHFNTNCIGGV